MAISTQSLRSFGIGSVYHPGPIRFEKPETVLARVAKTVHLWCERSRQRRQLSMLTAWELDDIGIDAKAAAAEASKPFWRA